MIDPALSVYLAGNKPIQVVLVGVTRPFCITLLTFEYQGFLVKYPGWGYTKAVAADPEQNALVLTLVRDTLTDIRSEFKAVVCSIFGGLEIITFSNTLL